MRPSALSHHSNTSTVRRRLGVRATTTAVAAALCATGIVAAGGLAAAPAAHAAGPTAHDPIGSTPTIRAVGRTLRVTGWGSDPDAPASNIPVSAYVDGTTSLGTVTTSLPSSKAAKRAGAGATAGYSLSVAAPAGKHTVCLVLGNVGRGMRTVKRCVATPLGRTLTAAQTAKHNPVGRFAAISATTTTVRARGWASDPDLVSRRSLAVLYVDGAPAATRATTRYAGTRPAGAGRSSAIDVSVPVSTGTHIACVWVVNVGLGSNTYLGCRSVDTRSPRTPAATAAPAANAKVLALAKKQIGKPYVWGATGPKSFDCSGLVMWAYGKYGYRTPRVSQDQIKAARLIPASHARAGDLVFYHDSVGDVYHVGVFVKPGLSVAAIDPSEGVDYQRIWDTTATYGSFTHT
ncbi:NlpC/P60 family protein [Jatrophihabitans endophyticus]|uniref:NlpC/P60 family protein n=1 Tax=Jatrophihabitans endophyticus TaxID=1206085 RepID=A0A1M5D767_9ACTN|nr:C40 family peptidase [Jatrophihabitans endophyticus]SHF62866.1 NlpC/P60 family protein [Jatrophihabitans endophyticus]